MKNENESEQSASSQISSSPDSATLNILVVEDNLTNQKVIVRQLESLGYQADIAANGQAALNAVSQTNYQIIFMDCRLPGMDGYTATRLIRQRQQLDGRPIIIALTANDEPQVQLEAKAAGMNDFLTKPLRRETLAATLEHWSQVIKAANGSELSESASFLFETNWNVHLDLARLHQLSDDNPEFEQELLLLYLSDTKTQLQQLQKGVEQQDLWQIEQVAHHIKGASASIGAGRLEAIAEAIEQYARQQQLELASSLTTKLEQSFDQLQKVWANSVNLIQPSRGYIKSV
jgi:CheY-like chemotaxis protein